MPVPTDLAHLRELPPVGPARLWLADLHPSPEVVVMMAGLLTASERARAGALRGPVAQRRFVVRRAALRMVLGGACGSEPARLRFHRAAGGKPILADMPDHERWEFSSSHARDLAVIGVARPHQLGIDLEWTGGVAPFEAVAQRFLSGAERADLGEAPGEERRERFFRIWVQKEALLKGIGLGITAEIRSTEFTGGSGGGQCGLARGDWRMQEISGLPGGYVGSIAVRAPAEARGSGDPEGPDGFPGARGAGLARIWHGGGNRTQVHQGN